VKALWDGTVIITTPMALCVKGSEGRLRGGEVSKSATWAKGPAQEGGSVAAGGPGKSKKGLRP
jgi:hypothetical protein